MPHTAEFCVRSLSISRPTLNLPVDCRVIRVPARWLAGHPLQGNRAVHLAGYNRTSCLPAPADADGSKISRKATPVTVHAPPSGWCEGEFTRSMKLHIRLRAPCHGSALPIISALLPLENVLLANRYVPSLLLSLSELAAPWLFPFLGNCTEQDASVLRR